MKNISIIFPEVKVEIGIEKLTFDTLENTVHKTGDELKRLVLEKSLKAIDEQLRKGRVKKELENRGKRGKYFLTRFGDIRYIRSRYEDRKTKKTRYLLDEKMGLIKEQRISLARAQMEIHLASLSPYRKVVEQTELIGNYKRSHESIRQSVLREAEKIIAHQQKSLDKIENLDYEEEAGINEIVYSEADATFIKQQKRRKGKRESRKKKSLEVKIGIGYTDKEPRYASGARKSNKLKDKFVFTSIGSSGRKFMENLSLIAEKRLGLSKAKRIFFGGDGGNWIRNGIRDYFPGAVYLLCLFHICRNIRESLSWRKQEQKIIKDLLMSNQIDNALERVGQMIKEPRDAKEKEHLENLYRFIANNRQGIINVVTIKDKRIKRTGAIEPNIDKVVAHRMKKRGMSWSKKGALSILKIQEKILNGEWQDWWYKNRDEKIEIRYMPNPLTATQVWKKTGAVKPFIEAEIPVLVGPHQDKPWVGVIRELTRARYLA